MWTTSKWRAPIWGYNDKFGSGVWGSGYGQYIFDANFLVGLPVIDRGRSKTALITDRDNVQPDGSGGSVAVDTPVIDSQYGLRTNGEYTQACQWSEDPGQWLLASGATRQATGAVFGPFTEYSVTDAGGIPDRITFWSSGASGSPSGALYGTVRYRAGTSGEIYFLCLDSSTADSTIYLGTIGAAAISVTDAGSLTIISDEYDNSLGYYILKFKIVFNNLSNALSISIGPNSTNNSNIKVLGADVSEDLAALSIHTTSEGSNVVIGTNYSYDDAGDQKGPHWDMGVTGALMPDLFGIFSGSQGVITDTWRPMHSASDLDNDTVVNIWSIDGDPTHGLYAHKDAGGIGYLKLSDGTNTVAVALEWDADTDYPWKAVFDTDEMQIQQGSNASTVGTFAGTFSPGQYLSYAEDTIEPQFCARHHQAEGYVKSTDWLTPT